jgi:hypothetical protein
MSTFQRTALGTAGGSGHLVSDRPRLTRVAYIVVHTLGSGCSPDEYPDVERFETDATAQVDFTYSDALDLAAEIRQHDGHWARIDTEFADGTRVIR